MSALTFPIERIGMVANFTHMRSGQAQMEVSLHMSQTHMRQLLKALGGAVSGETLTEWLKEDFQLGVTEIEVTK